MSSSRRYDRYIDVTRNLYPQYLHPQSPGIISMPRAVYQGADGGGKGKQAREVFNQILDATPEIIRAFKGSGQSAPPITSPGVNPQLQLPPSPTAPQTTQFKPSGSVNWPLVIGGGTVAVVGVGALIYFLTR